MLTVLRRPLFRWILPNRTRSWNLLTRCPNNWSLSDQFQSYTNRWSLFWDPHSFVISVKRVENRDKWEEGVEDMPSDPRLPILRMVSYMRYGIFGQSHQHGHIGSTHEYPELSLRYSINLILACFIALSCITGVLLK